MRQRQARSMVTATATAALGSHFTINERDQMTDRAMRRREKGEGRG